MTVQALAYCLDFVLKKGTAEAEKKTGRTGKM
jgi:hypothetical protein